MSKLLCIETDLKPFKYSLAGKQVLSDILKNGQLYKELANDTVISIVYWNEENVLKIMNILQTIIYDYQTKSGESIKVDMVALNTFAKNRLIFNLEKDFPEVSFILMGASDDSVLLKIKRGKK